MGVVLEQLYDEQGRIDMVAVADMIGESVAHVAQMTPLTPGALRKNPTSDRAQPAARRFVRVLSELTRLLGNRKAALIWLRAPHRELEDQSLGFALREAFRGRGGTRSELALGVAWLISQRRLERILASLAGSIRRGIFFARSIFSGYFEGHRYPRWAQGFMVAAITPRERSKPQA